METGILLCRSFFWPLHCNSGPVQARSICINYAYTIYSGDLDNNIRQESLI